MARSPTGTAIISLGIKEGNMEGNQSAAGGGIGFCELLTIVFIVLKLVGIIKWSWVWVLAPIWIPALVVGAIIVIIIARALMKRV